MQGLRPASKQGSCVSLVIQDRLFDQLFVMELFVMEALIICNNCQVQLTVQD